MNLFSSVQCVHAVTLADDRTVSLNQESDASSVHGAVDALRVFSAALSPASRAEALIVGKVDRAETLAARRHPLRKTYLGMLERCYYEKHKSYADYGGRGIRVCARWRGLQGFWNFVADMGPRPVGYTLDRRKNELGYEPNNCRWATRRQQCFNKRNNIRVVLGGEPVVAGNLPSVVPHSVVATRLRKGLSVGVATQWPIREGFIVAERRQPDITLITKVVEALARGLSHRKAMTALGVRYTDIKIAIFDAREMGLLPPAAPSRSKAMAVPRPRRSS